jgi:tetratricopeptide (TPR) repeat protein
MRKLAVLILFTICVFPSLSFGDEVHEHQLNRGIKNANIYSHLLMEESKVRMSSRDNLLKKALQYSPDLPAVYFELSKAHLSLSPERIIDSIYYLFEGVGAYSRNFWWSFTLAGSLFFSLLFSFILSIACIVIIRLMTDLSLISHDILEKKSKMFILAILILISALSPLLLCAGLLIILGLYMKKFDKSIVYFYLAILVLSPLIFKTATFFVHVSSSGAIKAIVQVNESAGNNYALSALRNADDPEGIFSYALALKREGYYGEAIAEYNRLIQLKKDPRAHVNLGNAFVGLNSFDEATEYYFKAIELEKLSSAYYNLSQLSRETFDFVKGNEYFQSAVAIDRNKVADYRIMYGRHPNRLVVDELLTFNDLWRYIIDQTPGTSTFGLMIIPVFLMTFISIGLLAGFFFLDRGLKNRAYRCRRCDAILCPVCEKRVKWREMCSQCYRSLVKIKELDVKDRVSRLQYIQKLQQRRSTFLKILAFMLPGSALIFRGRILHGLFFLWPFLFFVFVPICNIFFSTGILQFSHGFVEFVAILCAILIYIISNLITRKRIAKGWL